MLSRRHIIWASLFACACAEPEPGSGIDEALAGGGTTVFDQGSRAFSLSARNIEDEHLSGFFVGNSFFNKNWVIAPASTTARDGLGPTFNATSCSGCHFRDGRGRPPLSADEPMLSMLLRLSIPGQAEDGGPLPEPNYGGQLQPQSIPGVPAEGRAVVSWTELPGTYPDGAAYSLREPSYAFEDLAFGPLADELLFSPRVAPHMIGLGLLEAIDEDTILAAADPDDEDGDGISGRPNYPLDPISGEHLLGRFGWKANQVGLVQQNAGAFAGDIGITSMVHGEENCPPPQVECASAPTGTDAEGPELQDDLLDAVTVYSRLLAVPARREIDDPEVLLGRELFRDVGCDGCHTPMIVTGTLAGFPEVSEQTIFPYTDLLVHDMGPGLADGRPDYDADGSEWRTPPLWGVGLFDVVNDHALYLHDGRARGLEEAILWHGGEAQASRDAFTELDASDRAALVRFVHSL
ncbi:hypothetical protein PPSIR1_24904 [Plesiocystis pacifica SIR-1]|uniref:Cytochrome c domain-containing protein n=1 Tax=Plesiocystis pacifica SIR-1 TaxID=391625 RepID=A6G9H5_9BACT|nr:di-heme oxidoredictase family protein [Plesiocystis pacifica]EDM77483.1 hypothetical protein PPSIR1_24904 [Plesiocystis pacifica SIR-1]